MNAPLQSKTDSPKAGSLNSVYWLGLDLGGTSVKGVAVTPAGETLVQFHEFFQLAEPLAFASCVSVVVARATRQLGRPARIGLSAPGIAAADRRSIAHMPGRFAGLEGLIWSEFLDRPEGLTVLNDAQAALLGEVWLGAARGAREVILLTLGTGVGGAALVNGQLLRGHSGKAGHLGHLSLEADGVADICGTPGSLEDFIGNHNISTRSDGRFATTHDLICAYKSGDTAATKIWQRSVRALAAALASFGNILDPEIAVIGGGIAGAGEALFGPLREYLTAMEWRPAGTGMHIVPAELGEFAGAYGAAWQAGQNESH